MYMRKEAEANMPATIAKRARPTATLVLSALLVGTFLESQDFDSRRASMASSQQAYKRETLSDETMPMQLSATVESVLGVTTYWPVGYAAPTALSIGEVFARWPRN